MAGALFAGDALFWTRAIFEVGAGVTAVLVNAQVVMVPLLAALIDREPLRRAFLIVSPVMVAGILLAGGVLETGVSGSAPTRGTVHAILAAVCYSVFLFLLRRGGHTGHVVQSYLVVLVSAAIVGIVVGGPWHSVTLTPGWAALGWLALTAVCAQICGWFLIALVTSQLSSTVGAAMLMLTPVGALALSALVLEERPTVLQLIGCGLILVSTYAASVSSSSRRRFTTIVRSIQGTFRGTASDS